MPKFGESSLNKLSTCHPDIQKVMNEAIKLFDFTILYGYRNPQEQMELYKVGRKLNDKGVWEIVGKTVTNLDGTAKKSKHNYKPSKAIDIAPYPIDWNDIERFKVMSLVVLKCAKDLNIKLEWGGSWTMRDYPHFELKDK